ncbi:MAG: insulinase family protein [Propionivibrio sp.]|uniref:Insulinase family protein n=1 Tax=Candidatus Propionivibrio dominans TaxID=2954373 RepID=A0A9D7FED0_9RHOO|nr:insulinase family protein [Candidatus Propionivibrio dominans]MBL0166473.1 insulinase family protein [Propionivibrio sp.]
MKPAKLLALLCFCLVGRMAEAGPKIEHWIAPSGARVFFVENHTLPILDVQVDFAAGSSFDPPGQYGLAAMTQGLLDMGVQGMDETQISNRMADLGALLSGSADMDRASLSLRTLSAADKRTPSLEVLRAVLTTPQFPPEVFERERARTVVALKEALTRPEAIASKAFWAAMYPQHPYGRQAAPESVNSLQRADLMDFYRKHYTAQRASVSIVGDLSRAQAEALAQQLTAGLPAGSPVAALGVPQLPAAVEQRIAHPAAQAHVLLGLPALKRGDPDFFALVVGNYSLGGGGFVSRLMKEVREKRGYAYSVHSYFHPLAQLGPFQIGLQTKKAQANDALKVTREVLAGFLAEGPGEAELQAAKQNLVGSFPLRLDSNRKILENVAVIGFYGLPLDYLDRYAENVEKVTAAEIKAAFARHVRPENMVTVVVAGE